MIIEPDQITRSNRKTISITITRDAKVLVNAPLRLPSFEISKFVLTKQNWIQSKLLFISKSQESFDEVLHYKYMMFFGNKYPVYVSNSVSAVTFDNNRFLIPSTIADDKVLLGIKKWYISYAKSFLINRLEELSKHVRLSPKKVRIINAKTRWGCCNNKKTISLNWRVIMLEPTLIDYVIVHELSHLVEMNHSTKFWQIVGISVPDWMILRKDMKTYNFLLDLFR